MTKINYFSVMHYLALLVIPSYLFGTFFPDFLISISSIIFLIYSLKNKIFLYFNNNYFKLIIIFWLFISIKSFFSENFIASFIPSFFFVRFIIFSLLIWFLLENNKNFISNLFFILLIIFFFVNLHALTLHFFRVDFLFMDFSKFSLSHNFYKIGSQDHFLDYRISGVFYTEQILASFLLRTFPIFLLIFFIDGKKEKYKWLVFILSIMTFLSILFSGERSALFLSFVFIASVIIFLNKFNIVYKIFFSSIIFFFSFLFLITNPNLKSRLITNTINSLYEGRNNSGINIFSLGHQGHIDSALIMFKEKPLTGFGVKMFRYECLKDKYKHIKYGCTTHPHNTYVQLLAETGLIGFSFIFFFLLWLLAFFFRLIIFKKKKYYNSLVIITTAILVNLFPFVPTGSFFHNGLSMLYFFPIGFFMYLRNKYYNV